MPSVLTLKYFFPLCRFLKTGHGSVQCVIGSVVSLKQINSRSTFQSKQKDIHSFLQRLLSIRMERFCSKLSKTLRKMMQLPAKIEKQRKQRSSLKLHLKSMIVENNDFFVLYVSNIVKSILSNKQSCSKFKKSHPSFGDDKWRKLDFRIGQWRLFRHFFCEL